MPRPPKSGGAVFVPRSFAENRKKFGHTSTRLTSAPIESPHQTAAELQLEGRRDASMTINYSDEACQQ